MTTRKLIIYAGVILLSLTTVFAIVANTGSFRAQVALEEPCIAEVDVNGDGLTNVDDCTGGGTGGGNNGDICLDEVDEVVANATRETGSQTQAVTTIPKDCEEVCRIDEAFPPAHDGVTETAQQAAVTKADGDSKNILDAELRKLANDVTSKYYDPLRRLLRVIDGRAATRAEAQQVLNAFANGLSSNFNDPINYAKIQSGVLDPVTLLEKSVYEALTLSKQDKHYRSDPHDTTRNRQWTFLSGIKPSFSGWPSNLTLDGLKFDVLNFTSSNGAYSLCVEGGIGTANGNWNFQINSVDLRAKLFNDNFELTAGVNARGQARLGLFGSFRF